MPNYDEIASVINKTRTRLGERTARSELALDILAMKIAGQFKSDPAFDRNTFATTAGLPSHPTHLVSGSDLI